MYNQKKEEMRLTKNFTFEELLVSDTAARCGIENIPNENAQVNLVKLAYTVLQPIRDAWGAPIAVNSGFRCQTLNTKIGGAAKSDHIYGAAADIRTLSNTMENNKKLFELIVKMAKEGKIQCRQIIDEKNYQRVHVSVNHPEKEFINNQAFHLK